MLCNEKIVGLERERRRERKGEEFMVDVFQLTMWFGAPSTASTAFISVISRNVMQGVDSEESTHMGAVVYGMRVK